MKYINKSFFALLILILLIFSIIGFVSSESSAFGEEILKDNYLISRSKIDRTVALGTPKARCY